MRRLASEVLRDLEIRVANLEDLEDLINNHEPEGYVERHKRLKEILTFNKKTETEIAKVLMKLYKSGKVKVKGWLEDEGMKSSIEIKINFEVENLIRHISPIIQKYERKKFTDKEIHIILDERDNSFIGYNFLKELQRIGLPNLLKIKDFDWKHLSIDDDRAVGVREAMSTRSTFDIDDSDWWIGFDLGFDYRSKKYFGLHIPLEW
jgi:hypothetical protein